MALAQARLAWGIAKPNPAVGCVLVREGQIVGQGHTQEIGGPHAEVMALKDAGEQAQGATAYVTLEPCSHFGRTSPCSQGLIEAGVAKESARMILPLTTETTMYMKGNLRSWIHYIDLRTKENTQKEHRDIASECKRIFKNEFPNVSEAIWDLET